MEKPDPRSASADPELVSRISEAYGVPASQAERIIEEVLIAYGDTVEEWVRSRHIRLRSRGMRNEDIYRRLEEELPHRRFSSEPLSLRQIRRLIYG
jgi:hypothetical protein